MANKDKIVKGLNQLALAFPFFLLGPSFYYWKGAKGIDNGQWWWTAISAALMLTAIFFLVRGLRLTMAGFFDSNSN